MEKTMDRRYLMRRLAALSLGTAALPFSVFSQDLIDTPTLYIPPGEGKQGRIGQMDIRFKLSGKQTAGHMGLWESVIQPGELGAPPHYHAKTDEICRVLEGTLHIMTGNEITEVKAGGWHLRPRNVVHTFWNSGKIPAKTIDICVPGGHENYMQELADLFKNGLSPKPGDMTGLERKHDIHYRFDLLQSIQEKYGVTL